MQSQRLTYKYENGLVNEISSSKQARFCEKIIRTASMLFRKMKVLLLSLTNDWDPRSKHWIGGNDVVKQKTADAYHFCKTRAFLCLPGSACAVEIISREYCNSTTMLIVWLKIQNKQISSLFTRRLQIIRPQICS